MHKLNTDGGARGNPGPAAAGLVISNSDNAILYTEGKYLGVSTNNEAEYQALVLGLHKLLDLNIKECECELDSELVVKQLNGQYKVKNERLEVFFNQIKKLKNSFKTLTFTHIKRDKNKLADKIVNQVLDEQEKA